MQPQIHPTAIVSSSAKLGKNVSIGPFCCVGDNVCLEDNVVLKSHVVIEGDTHVGEGTEIYPFASIGQIPQDLKFKGEPSKLIIGKNNRIREYVTMQPGTEDGCMTTRVGDNGLFMAGSHIAHDCQVGNNVVMANYALLAGHVTVGDNVFIGGLAAVHQFVRIGHNAYIGGKAGIKQDVIPYALVMGTPSSMAGINLVGLKRSGVSAESIRLLLQAYNEIFDKENKTLAERVKSASNTYAKEQHIMNILNFINQDSSRPLCIPA